MEIKISAEESLQLEKIHYEISARKSLLAYLISNDFPKESESFLRYHQEYLDFIKQDEQLKANISKKYVIPHFPDKKVKWSLDFETCTLTIDEK